LRLYSKRRDCDQRAKSDRNHNPSDVSPSEH
jgi:hypothetical protein